MTDADTEITNHCDICNRDFKNKWGLTVHNTKKHSSGNLTPTKGRRKPRTEKKHDQTGISQEEIAKALQDQRSAGYLEAVLERHAKDYGRDVGDLTAGCIHALQRTLLRA